MANRFINPNPQFFDNNGVALSDGTLSFYLTGTSTPAATFIDAALTNPNSWPVPLDSAGRPEEPIFLSPAVTYKVVLADSAAIPLWTLDPVVDPAANVTAAVQVYPGDPNGNLAGNQGTSGGSGASMVWDITHNLLYICTTTGDETTAVWTSTTATQAGAVIKSGVLTPASLSVSPGADAYNPPDFLSSSSVRQDLSADVSITDFPIGAAGQELRWRNISAANVASFVNGNAGSTAARRFVLPGPINLGPGDGSDFQYDGVLSRWVLTALLGHDGRTILTDGANIAWDLSTGIDFEVTLGGNRTLSAFTKGTPGQEGMLVVKQDVTGGRSLDVSNAVYDFPGGFVQNVARGVSDETFYHYKVISATAMQIKRLGATTIGDGGSDLLDVKLASNSATIDFVLTKWLALYDRFEIDFEDVLPATNDVALGLRTSTNGGSSYDAGANDYIWTRLLYVHTGSGFNATGGDDVIELNGPGGTGGLSNVALEAASGKVILHNPGAAGKTRVSWWINYICDNVSLVDAAYNGFGVRNAALDTDAVRFAMSSGNIASGTFRLYGMRK